MVAKTDLVPAALAPFRAMLWIGVVLTVIAVVVWFVGLSQTSYYDNSAQVAAFAFAAGAVGASVPFYIASALIAGLGQRQPQAASTSTPPVASTDQGVYVPAAE